jgi:hypothetical protein
MGFKDWFKKSASSGASAAGPSPEHATARDAIRALLDVDAAAGDDGMWLTFEAEGAGKKATLEVSGKSVNVLTTEVDLPALLDGLGLTTLAACVRAEGTEDRTCWLVPDASAEELAAIVDEGFVSALGLGSGFGVRGERHG